MPDALDPACLVDGPSLSTLADAIKRGDLASADIALTEAVADDEDALEWVARGRGVAA